MGLSSGIMSFSPFLFPYLGIFRQWFSVGWFRNGWCMDFSSPVPLRAPRRAAVRVAGGLWGSQLTLGFWLQGRLVASRWRPSQL